ncbi:MAG: hypothetical protein MJE68_14860 [Proteobacteria bacterium]|nr:hypothetical protein [Pseudomonadota bacterium]
MSEKKIISDSEDAGKYGERIAVLETEMKGVKEQLAHRTRFARDVILVLVGAGLAWFFQNVPLW